MPSLKPNFICRGARLATQITSRPTNSSGLVRFFDACEYGFPHVAAEAERELQQLPGVGHFFGGENAGHAQIDFGEIVDRAFRGEWLCGQRFGAIGRCARLVARG